jgi:hypothetical protein
MGEDGKDWIKASRRWLKKFFKELGASEFKFSKGHYEWTLFVKLGDQWWYLSSGDVRFKVCNWLLVRKADGPQDYTGHHNQRVSYDSTDFAGALKNLLEGGVTWL